MILKSDIDNLMNNEQDPDTYYFFIKEAINNLDNEIQFSISKEKKFHLNLITHLEVFRAVMQYIEEFALYLLAYANDEELSTYIVKTQPEVIRKAFQEIYTNNHDDFAKEIDYKDFKDFLRNVFNFKSIPISIPRKETYNNLKDGLNKIGWFFIYYLELYNAIKHGSRVFPRNISRIDIPDNKNDKLISIEIDEPYFEAICKPRGSGGIYSLNYPADLLIDNSIRVLEDVNELFNFLRKTNNYEKSSPFNYNVQNNILKYVRAYNAEYSFFLKDSIELRKN